MVRGGSRRLCEMSRAVGLNGFWGALRSFGVLGVALVSEGLGRSGLQELRPSKGGRL